MRNSSAATSTLLLQVASNSATIPTTLPSFQTTCKWPSNLLIMKSTSQLVSGLTASSLLTKVSRNALFSYSSTPPSTLHTLQNSHRTSDNITILTNHLFNQSTNTITYFRSGRGETTKADVSLLNSTQ
mmetsp:Transcript_6956/g.10353  ORF Transcript_6956/g.10353 Transcript_6956/m.10353 type:complete len:128 (-) Transcript_6956:251-634(-)